MCQDMLMKYDEVRFDNVSSSPEGLHRVSSSRAVLGMAWLNTSHLPSAGRTTTTYDWNLHTIYKIIFKSRHKNTNHLHRFASHQPRKNTSYSPITPCPATHSQGDSLRLRLLHCKSHAVKSHLGKLQFLAFQLDGKNLHNWVKQKCSKSPPCLQFIVRKTHVIHLSGKQVAINFHQLYP